MVVGLDHRFLKAPLSKGGRGDLNFRFRQLFILWNSAIFSNWENDFLATFEGLIPPTPLAKGGFLLFFVE